VDEKKTKEVHPEDDTQAAIDLNDEELLGEKPAEEPELDISEEDAKFLQDEAVEMTADVPVRLVAVLGKKTLSFQELLKMKLGQVINLERPANEIVDLVANGKVVARGELVEIDGQLGVKVIKVLK